MDGAAPHLARALLGAVQNRKVLKEGWIEGGGNRRKEDYF